MLGTLPRRGLPLLALLGSGLAAVACDAVDPSFPVSLVLDDELSKTHVQAVENAAECWNLELGTALQVTRDEDAPQPVTVALSDFICGYASGQATGVAQLQIHLCSAMEEGSQISAVARHEIGHTLGIWQHGDDPWAVMSPGAEDYNNTLFRPEDRALFLEANPDFVPNRTRCGLVHQLGTTPRRPMLIRDGAQGFWLVHVVEGGIVISRVSEAWKVTEVTRIKTRGHVSYIRALSTSAGALVSWIQDKAIHFTTVALPGGKLGPTRRVSPAEAISGEMGMSVARVPPHLYFAVAPYWIHSYLYQVDEATGAVRKAGVADDGKILAHGGELYFVSAAEVDDKHSVRSLRVERLDLTQPGDTIGLADRLVLVPDMQVTPINVRTFEAVPTSRGILVLQAPFDEPQASLRLFQVQAQGAPVLERKRVLPVMKKGAGVGSIADTLEHGSDLYLALGMSSPTHYYREAYLVRLDAQSLAVRTGWTRLSPPDIASSVQPRLARAGDQLMVVWRDWYDNWLNRYSERLDDHDIKGRCVPLR